MRNVILLSLFLASMSVADDTAGISEQCAVCHGVDGVSRWADVPNIAGLPDVVIANALYDFRGHERPCRKPSCATSGECPNLDMCQISEPLSDGAMDTLARKYSERPFSPSIADYDPQLAAAGRIIHEAHCERCHTKGGGEPLDEASILRGQNMTYMRNAITDFREKQRIGEQPMLERMQKLDDSEAEALVHFYASPAD
jgi:sulfide dehydrogenase cytochrome subunit